MRIFNRNKHHCTLSHKAMNIANVAKDTCCNYLVIVGKNNRKVSSNDFLLQVCWTQLADFFHLIAKFLLVFYLIIRG